MQEYLDLTIRRFKSTNNERKKMEKKLSKMKEKKMEKKL